MSARPASSAPTSTEIRLEIERTREAMDQTLDSLGELFSPTRLVRAVCDGIADMGTDLLRIARLSPVTLVGSSLVVGFVVGQLLGRRR